MAALLPKTPVNWLVFVLTVKRGCGELHCVVYEGYIRLIRRVSTSTADKNNAAIMKIMLNVKEPVRFLR